MVVSLSFFVNPSVSHRRFGRHAWQQGAYLNSKKKIQTQTIGFFPPTTLPWVKKWKRFHLYEWWFSAACLNTCVRSLSRWQPTISMSDEALCFMMFFPHLLATLKSLWLFLVLYKNLSTNLCKLCMLFQVYMLLVNR